MLGSKPKVIVFVSKGSLQFYTVNPDDNEILNLSQDVIKNFQVIDEEKLQEDVTLFLTKSDFRKEKAILILGNDLLLEKTVKVEESKDANLPAGKAGFKEDDVFEKISFETGKLVVKKLEDEKEIHYVGTNSQLFQVLKHSLEIEGWTVEMVIPVTLFAQASTKTSFKSSEIEQILAKRNALKAGNFLDEKTDTPVAEQEPEGEKDGKKPTEKVEKTSVGRGDGKKYFFILFAMTLIIMSGAFFLYEKGSLPFLNSLVAAPTPTPKPTATPTPTPSEVSKKDIKVQILNGTGKAGQAGRARALFLKLEFEDQNINVGNVEEGDESKGETKVVFSEKVSTELRKEVTAELEKLFTDVVEEKPEKLTEHDIVVITGDEL